MTDERRARYDFTNRYYQVPAKFVAKVGGNAPARFDNAALKGVKVGVEDNSVFANFATDRFGSVVNLVRYPTLPTALDALGKGEVQLVLGDALALDTDFLKTPDGKGFRFVGPDMLDPGWFGDGVGIAVRKDEAGLREQLNGAIAKLRADGRYQKIASRYFDFDIYGPDVKPRPRVLVNMPAANAPWRHLQRPPGDDLGMHR
jgi:arginine/ornithine transport system substrate-binding protein